VLCLVLQSARKLWLKAFTHLFSKDCSHMDFKTAFISLGFLQSEHPLTIADQSASYIHLILYFYGFLSFSNLCRERKKTITKGTQLQFSMPRKKDFFPH